MKNAIGVLGGMGPLATVDFINKLIRLTPARCDQEHIPLLVYSVPQIPDRSDHILHHSASPLPGMLEGVRNLTQSGVGCIVVPCHTAHYWYPELQSATEVEIFNIAEITVDMLSEKPAVQRVGLLATEGTIRAGIYQQTLAKQDLTPIVPGKSTQDKITEIIAWVKANRIKESASLLQEVVEELLADGSDRIILACTEIPLVTDHLDTHLNSLCLDATEALALACIDWYESRPA